MKGRLSILYFLQFSIWGCYLTCFGQFLGAGGLGGEIAWFYAAIGAVSIFTPPLLGRLADKTGRPVRLLTVCHLFAAFVMLIMFRYGTTHSQLEFRVIYPLYLAFLAFYMPTMALANTATFGLLTQRGYNTVTDFPSIRIWGTVGFVAAMWFVNSAYVNGHTLGFSLSDDSPLGHSRFQYNSMQLLCSGIMGLITCAYTLSLPALKDFAGKNTNSTEQKLSFKDSLKSMQNRHHIALFLIFAIFAGVCLQISNGYVTPFITHFTGISEYTNSLASGNATMLFSLSQISEAICILLVGVALKWKGIKGVYAIGLLAWSLRFFMLGAGNPGNGLWLLIGSMLVYGIAFNFITIAGHIYIQQIAPAKMKGLAQGTLMFMSNGLGATFGTLAAGSIINNWCSWEFVTLPGTDTKLRLFMGEWNYPWYIFAGYALVVMLAWLIFFRNKSLSQKNKDS